ncbi:endolytic transglycosylase MltG [Anaerotruncus rubiinfantis]|uniref:endolytic transglycosylase MltG n=1 Tax=Anaerotruncus rubiinfantis TaxID=1720200 RepID=UPI00189B6004|nr:endolytic transglycosylase MltG [Anaerotruncus rubiinfantis]
MSDHDEFESLIKSFKLDDVESPAQPAEPARQQRRQAFNYDEDSRRYTAARQAHGADQAGAQPARRQTVAVPRPRASEGQQAPPPSGRDEKKRNFQVKIDDSEFYEPSEPSVQPSYGGGGGRRGGRRNGDDDGDRSGGAGRWFKALLVLIVVLAVSVFLAMFALQSASDLFGLNKPDSPVELELPDNLSMSEVASLLKEKGVITQPLTFQVYAGLKNKAESFIPGTYMLNTNMSYDEIMRDFRSGNIKRVEVTVMFPEGMTLSDMANRLEENNVCKAEDLYEYLEESDFPWEYKFLEQVPEDENLFRRWEGYFFPDTYIFYEEMSPSAVTQRFFANFNNKMTDKLYERMDELGMSLSDTITLASVIQREAGLGEDMVGVSMVFHNRLAEGSPLPMLQSDVTRDYVNNYIKPFLPDAVNKEANPDLTDPNQAMYDAYNTYVRQGLPVGPVCNPGMAAIEAALQLPVETLDGTFKNYEDYANYYYFVTDEAGEYYYAATLDEHNQNVAAAAQNGEVHGTDVTTEEVPT